MSEDYGKDAQGELSARHVSRYKYGTGIAPRTDVSRRLYLCVSASFRGLRIASMIVLSVVPAAVFLFLHWPHPRHSGGPPPLHWHHSFESSGITTVPLGELVIPLMYTHTHLSCLYPTAVLHLRQQLEVLGLCVGRRFHRVRNSFMPSPSDGISNSTLRGYIQHGQLENVTFAPQPSTAG